MAADTNLNIIVSLKDQASEAFKKVGDDIGRTAEQMGSKLGFLSTDVTGLSKALLGVGVAAAGTAIAFGVSSVKAYEQAEVAMARVQQSVSNTFDTFKAAKLNKLQEEVNLAFGEGSDVVDGYLTFIKDLSAATVRLGFDDETAAESIARFFQATGDLTQATKLNNIAMDLARAKNLDLATAAGLVNQVLSGNGRVLKQYQINLKDSATPLEALGELQEKVAGQASAFAGTFQGQMQVLSVSFENIKEEIGKVLVDALTPFIQQFTAWLLNPKTQESFKQWTSEFQSWAEVIIPTIIDVFKMWFDVAQSVFNVIVKIGEAMDKASQAAIGLGGSIKSAWSNAGSNIQWALGGMIPGRASGGPVSSGSPYLVGENGPELFMPSSSGTIVPNSGMGGTTMILNFSGSFFGTDQQTAEKFGNMIARTLGQQLKVRTI